MRHVLHRAATITSLVTMLLAYTSAAHADAYAFALCNKSSPEAYVVRFFERLEQIDSANLNDDFYLTYFSSAFKNRTAPQAVLEIVDNARDRFNLTIVGVPFSKRVIGLPQVEKSAKRLSVEITYLALGGRGKLLQSANVVCEAQHWRADGFAYEPAADGTSK